MEDILKLQQVLDEWEAANERVRKEILELTYQRKGKTKIDEQLGAGIDASVGETPPTAVCPPSEVQMPVQVHFMLPHELLAHMRNKRKSEPSSETIPDAKKPCPED